MEAAQAARVHAGSMAGRVETPSAQRPPDIPPLRRVRETFPVRQEPSFGAASAEKAKGMAEEEAGARAADMAEEEANEAHRDPAA